MKEKFKEWYLNQFETNKVLFFLVHLFILVIIIGTFL